MLVGALVRGMAGSHGENCAEYLMQIWTVAGSTRMACIGTFVILLLCHSSLQTAHGRIRKEFLLMNWCDRECVGFLPTFCCFLVHRESAVKDKEKTLTRDVKRYESFNCVGSDFIVVGIESQIFQQ